MKTGIELEYWVIDEEGKLSSCLEIAERIEYAEPETTPVMIEIKTDPHENFDDLKAEAVTRIEKLIEEAEKSGKKIVPLGTPLNSGPLELLSHSRRLDIKQKIVGGDQDVAKRIAGTHIHFEKKSVADQFNLLTALDPAQALIASSPYYQGEKMGASSRNHAYRNIRHGEAPEYGKLWRYSDSDHELESRIERRFEKFVKNAEKKGIEKEEVREYYTPYDAVWTPVRVRTDFPTVEWRAPDTALPSQMLELVRQLKSLMESPEKPEMPGFDRLKELSGKAMKEGLESREVRDYLEKMGLEPGKFRNLSKYYENGSSVSRAEARKIRLQAAKEMKSDVEDLRSVRALHSISPSHSDSSL